MFQEPLGSLIFICQGIALDGIVLDGFCQTIQVYISLDSKIYFWKKTKIFLDSSKIDRNSEQQFPHSLLGKKLKFAQIFEFSTISKLKKGIVSAETILGNTVYVIKGLIICLSSQFIQIHYLSSADFLHVFLEEFRFHLYITGEIEKHKINMKYRGH